MIAAPMNVSAIDVISPQNITTKALIFVGAGVLVFTLYSWLLSPLEPEHH